MVTSLGGCCWPGRRVPQSPDCWSSCNIQRKKREGALDDGKGMVIDVEGVQRGVCLGGREMLSSTRDGIRVHAVVVVVLMAAVRVVVLMAVVGVVVVVIVMGVLCIGAVKVDCTGVVDVLVLGGVFVVEVGGSETGGGVCCEASPVVCN